MVAFKLLDKALTQLKMQREFGSLGGMTFSEPSMSPPCTNIQTKAQQSQPAASAQAVTPRTPLKSKVTWAPGLELLGGNHEPWTATQPTKPILKAQEYAESGFNAQTCHWSDRSEALAAPAPMITCVSASKSTCIKLITKKRTREVAFLD